MLLHMKQVAHLKIYIILAEFFQSANKRKSETLTTDHR